MALWGLKVDSLLIHVKWGACLGVSAIPAGLQARSTVKEAVQPLPAIPLSASAARKPRPGQVPPSTCGCSQIKNASLCPRGLIVGL